MMRRIIALLISAVMLISLASCGNGKDKTSNEEARQDSSSGNKDAGEIEVEKEIFDVVITLPAEMMGEVTQEELDATVSEGNFHTAVLNEDGSVTYEMSKRMHKKLMAEMAGEISESLNEMIGSEEYPNFTNIEGNSDYTHFIVTTKSSELELAESFSVLGFYVMGGLYAAFNGDSDVEITVDFVNADTGEIIDSASSAEMEN